MLQEFLLESEHRCLKAHYNTTWILPGYKSPRACNVLSIQFFTARDVDCTARSPGSLTPGPDNSSVMDSCRQWRTYIYMNISHYVPHIYQDSSFSFKFSNMLIILNLFSTCCWLLVSMVSILVHGVLHGVPPSHLNEANATAPKGETSWRPIRPSLSLGYLLNGEQYFQHS